MWKPLFESGIHIDFAHHTFRWDSEAKIKAHVHCVIIGFSAATNKKPKVLFTSDRPQIVHNINGYLLDAENIFVESRKKPICSVPSIGIGNKPVDGGFYLFEKNEMESFLEKEPAAEKYFKPWYGSQEFINCRPRYCLWLGECQPNELRKLPECMKRVEAVRQFRLASKSPGTVKLADKPTHFHVENMPKGTHIVVPEVSSERRRYIPMGYMDDTVLCSNLVKIIPNANLYYFGVLTSNIHMAWMRAVGGRLKSDYRYSKDIVYNNFPWPEPTKATNEGTRGGSSPAHGEPSNSPPPSIPSGRGEPYQPKEQMIKIEQTAQAILDARSLYPNSSLADLYDELVMPPELRKAHQRNDIAVMRAYGITNKDAAFSSESACVAELMKRYQSIVNKIKN